MSDTGGICGFDIRDLHRVFKFEYVHLAPANAFETQRAPNPEMKEVREVKDVPKTHHPSAFYSEKSAEKEVKDVVRLYPLYRDAYRLF